VFQWTYPTFEWFVGAKCNIAQNCLDRQVKSGRKNKVAYIWTTEDRYRISRNESRLVRDRC
jgi:acetyl-CoA synthetase